MPSPQRVGDPRALLAARLLAAAALIVTVFIHGKLAMQFGMGGQLLSQGQLFATQATISAILAGALLTRSNKRVWLFAVVLSLSGLVGVLVSVYLPVPALGPLPAIDEQMWFMTKIVAAFAQASVPALWLIRRIAPSSPPH